LGEVYDIYVRRRNINVVHLAKIRSCRFLTSGTLWSRVRGINHDGIMVGHYLRPEFDIVPPEALDSFALGINSQNQLVGVSTSTPS
jgi:hypothetical protein